MAFVCSVCGCGKQATYKDKCSRCYNRWYRASHDGFKSHVNLKRKEIYYRNREHEIQRTLNTRLKDPVKWACYRRYWSALKNNVISRGDHCVNCGVACKPDGHHSDYMRPLDVMWLCRSCHNLLTGGIFSHNVFDNRYIDYMMSL
jgi:hypothetical protein